MKLGLSLLVLAVSCFLLIQAQKEKPGEKTRPTVKPTPSSQEVVVAPPKPVSPPSEEGGSEENSAGRKKLKPKKKLKPTAVVICPAPSRSLGFLVPESPLLIPFPRRARQPGRPKPSKSIEIDQLKTKLGPRPTGFPKPTKRIPKCPPCGGRFDSEDCTTITFGGPRRTALPSPLLSRFRSFFTGRRREETSRPRPSRVLEHLRPSGIPRFTLRGGRKCLLYPEKSAGCPQPTVVPSRTPVPQLGIDDPPTPPARPSMVSSRPPPSAKPTPSNPPTPGNPGNPGHPGNPGRPGHPGRPGNPGHPGNPGRPGRPGK